MPRDAFTLPLREYLQLRLENFLLTVRALGLPEDRDGAKEYYPLWKWEYRTFHQQLAA